MLDNLLSAFAGQTVKHRPVGYQKISIRWKVLLTKTTKWLEVAVGNACREDQGLKGFHDTRPSMQVSKIQIELRLCRTIGILVLGQR